jgi:hypothetical protein
MQSHGGRQVVVVAPQFRHAGRRLQRLQAPGDVRRRFSPSLRQERQALHVER